MKTTIEEILGVDKIPLQREIPGTISVSGREFLYIEDDGDDNFDKLFLRLVRAVDPTLYNSGGALTGGCELTLPDNRKFHAMSYKSDLQGWRSQILEGAKKLEIEIAKIENRNVVTLQGDVFPLSHCVVRFY